MTILRKLPASAAAIGLGAFVVAVTGSAVAVPSLHSAINGSTIKNHSIAGKKLKNNTVTGKQVKESTLIGVASAKNAKRLGGTAPSGFVRASSFFRIPLTTMNVGNPTKILGKFGPLTFIATCIAGTNPVATISVTTSKTIDISSATSLTVLAPGASPLVLATAEEPDPRNARTGFPAAAIPGDRSFALSGSGGLVAENNATGADCAFWGDLQNDGS